MAKRTLLERIENADVPGRALLSEWCATLNENQAAIVLEEIAIRPELLGFLAQTIEKKLRAANTRDQELWKSIVAEEEALMKSSPF